MIAVDAEKCVRCGACVRDCIVEVLKPGADGVPCVASGEERFCLNCQHCLAVCPQGAVVCNGVTPEECAGIGPLPARRSCSTCSASGAASGSTAGKP